ncbi:MAG: PKD domain-containing protein, partial [Cocleimonas sp.]|nr:PKD domain-containing protein [Cocleimonas sp.]
MRSDLDQKVIMMTKWNINVLIIVSLLFIGGGIFTLTKNQTRDDISLNNQRVEQKKPETLIQPHLPIERSDVKQTNEINSKVVLHDFSQWLQSTITANQALQLAKGVELAKKRQPLMLDLIKKNPQLALQHSLSFSQYDALPPEIAKWVEKPFSQRGDLLVLPKEQNNTRNETSNAQLILKVNNKPIAHKLYRYGQRTDILSKNGIVLQGITLNGIAAVKENALMPVSDHERNYIQTHFPNARTNIKIDTYTGNKIEAKPVLALAGGQVFYFSSLQNINQLNRKLAQLEQEIGPDTGSQFLLTESNLNETGFAQNAVGERFQLRAKPSSWTLTKKKIYIIRVDFSDKVGEPVDRDTLAKQFNGNVSSLIKNISKGKTWLEVGVSEAVVRVPNTSTFYVSGDQSNTLYDDAKTAFNTLNSGVDLNQYDIVGVYFTRIGMKYAGRATLGGKRLWLHNNYSTRVLTHEIGHNYGLAHASFWETSNKSIIGEGETEEYGDKFDIMGSGSAPNGYFHPQALVRLNWLESNQFNEITKSGTYRLHRFDHKKATGVQGLRVDRGDGGFYWLGYRQNFDNQWLKKGIYLLWQQPKSLKSWLIDTTPGSFTDNKKDKDDASVILGRTYSDTIAGIHITPTAIGGSASDEWIELQINLGAFKNNQPPSVTLSKVKAVTVRKEISFTANATDTNGDPLAYQWDFGDGVIHNSGPTVQHQWIIGGTYTIKVTVSDMKGGVATDQMTVTVTDPLTQWTARNAPTTANLNNIATNGTQLIAVGSSPKPIRSINGIDWTNDKVALTNKSGGDFYNKNIRLFG